MINLHDDFLSHPKFKLALAMGGLDALHVWFGMQMHAHQRLTDGFIPELVAYDVVDGPKGKKARQKAIDALVNCRLEEGRHGLLEIVPGGFQLHNYLKYSKSKERVLAEREFWRNKKRGQRGGPTLELDEFPPDVPIHVPRAVPTTVPQGTLAGTPIGVPRVSSDPVRSGPDQTEQTPPRARAQDAFGKSLTTPEDELPDGWQPNEANRQLGARLKLNVDQELALYSAHRRRVHYRCGNWDADFEVWLRRASKMNLERSGSKRGQHRPVQTEQNPAVSGLENANRGY